jgi:hypothetical protein
VGPADGALPIERLHEVRLKLEQIAAITALLRVLPDSAGH